MASKPRNYSSEFKAKVVLEIVSCAHCARTFVETFDTLYYWRQVSADEVETILQF